MSSTVTRVVAGFIAGVLAVLIFHQGMYLIMQTYGAPYGIKLGGSPWNLGPDPAAYGLPRVANQAFWGGLWGIVFAFLVDHIPAGPNWLRGIVFGCIFPMLLGSWLVVALIKGTPLFSNAFGQGFNILALRNGFLLNGLAFGLGVGVIYPLLAGMMGARSTVRA